MRCDDVTMLCLQMPEIKAIVNSFADGIIKEIENKVQRDDWAKERCSHLEVSLPRRAQVKLPTPSAGKPKGNAVNRI